MREPIHENPKWFIIKPARFVPASLTVAAIIAGFTFSPWCFLSIPFVLIGSAFTAPNLNLANGMPSYLCILAGWILVFLHQPSGLAILVGTMTGFYGSSLEMRIFAKPATHRNHSRIFLG